MSNEKYKHITDQQLLEHFYADHDMQWLGILLQRYTLLLLLGVCMKYLKNEEEAKDSVQQIFPENNYRNCRNIKLNISSRGYTW